MSNSIYGSIYTMKTAPHDCNYVSSVKQKTEKQATRDCKLQAINALEDFRDFKLLSEDDFKELVRKIKRAKSDDEISLLMNRVRYKMFA